MNALNETKIFRGPQAATPLLPPSEAFPWPTLPIDVGKLLRYMQACEDAGVGYRLGGKADALGPLSAFPPRYGSIDCSGWVRAAVCYATGGALAIPDGSVNQHAWCHGQGLKLSTVSALGLSDGALRIGFYLPTPAHPIGHVFLCRYGRTLESCGGRGPTRLPWLSRLMRTRAVYVLTAPEVS